MTTDPTPGRHALERELAPHLHPAWTEAVLLELRLRDVDGATIGAVLAEVDAFCVDSGQSAVDAFGDPTAYAASLTLTAATTGSPARGLWRSVVPTAVGVVGMLLVVWAVGAWRSGDPVGVAAWHLVALAFVLAGMAGLVAGADVVLRTVVRRPFWWSWLLGMAVLAVVVAGVAAAQLRWPDVLWHLPATAAAGVGAAAIVLGVALDRPAGVDPVVVPSASAPRRPTRRERALADSRWLIPAATLVLVGLTIAVG